jgi:hypothetical protein
MARATDESCSVRANDCQLIANNQEEWLAKENSLGLQ